jgi:hypothetical protein
MRVALERHDSILRSATFPDDRLGRDFWSRRPTTGNADWASY